MFIASGRILVLVAAFFSVKILIGKVLKNDFYSFRQDLGFGGYFFSFKIKEELEN